MIPKRNKARIRTHLLALIYILPASVALSTAQAAKKIPGDLVLQRSQGSVSAQMTPPSIFPHWIHRINFRCDACHDRLFKMELGASEISMDQMKNGGSCGTCHNGEVAFEVSFQSCNRCHVSTSSDVPVAKND